MHLSEIRNQICAIPVVRDLPEKLRARICMILLGIGHEVTATEGQILFEEGEGDNDVAYILLQGEILVQKSDSPEIVAQAPDLLGEVVKFSPMSRRSATVSAKGEVKLLKFIWAEFFDAIDQVFPPEEQIQVRQALEDIAWGHFAG
jgi:CRP-like cAMP-binding protein